MAKSKIAAALFDNVSLDKASLIIESLFIELLDSGSKVRGRRVSGVKLAKRLVGLPRRFVTVAGGVMEFCGGIVWRSMANGTKLVGSANSGGSHKS